MSKELKDQAVYVWAIIMRNVLWFLSVGLLGQRAQVLERAEVKAMAARKRVLEAEARRLGEHLEKHADSAVARHRHDTAKVHLKEVKEALERRSA